MNNRYSQMVAFGNIYIKSNSFCRSPLIDKTFFVKTTAYPIKSVAASTRGLRSYLTFKD